MLFASFLVTIAIMVAPVVLLGAALYVGGMTATLVHSAIPSISVDSGRPPQRPRAGRSAPSPEESDFLRRLSELVSALSWTVAILLLTGLSLWPLCSALILFFYLTFDVSIRRPEDVKAFDLVYESFTEMLAVARQKWKEVLLSGLFITAALALLGFLIGVATMLLARGNFVRMSNWLMTVGVPIAAFAFVISVILFMATTCLQLKDRSAASAAHGPFR